MYERISCPSEARVDALDGMGQSQVPLASTVLARPVVQEPLAVLLLARLVV